MKLYIKQKVFSLKDRYNIFDEAGNPIFLVESKFFSIGAKFHILDLNGNELFYIQQKVLTFLAEYDIFKGQTHYAKIKKQFSFFKPKINVESQYGSYMINGEIFNMLFQIVCNNQVIGSVKKKWLSWGDTYELEIFGQSDPAFFCCMVIAIDHSLHNDDGNHSF